MPKERFTKFGTTAADLTQAYQDRLRDAQVLQAAGRHAAAVHMGAYALEMLLKCCICRKMDEPRLLTAFYIHDPEGLLILAGLRQAMDLPNNAAIKTNWNSVAAEAKRAIEYRYQPDSVVAPAEAGDFLGKLTDPNDGVVPWLEKFR